MPVGEGVVGWVSEVVGVQEVVGWGSQGWWGSRSSGGPGVVMVQG